eukprot:comp21502_c0_seq1/m.29823 comp21502_c0_seq1/g.29823  ORF comp21502_c0_seq1/g.29823 comp21502_c0_seq1/m.29823 type:complete len:101 (-) comp21502_c0_seq1:654-956(-)
MTRKGAHGPASGTKAHGPTSGCAVRVPRHLQALVARFEADMIKKCPESPIPMRPAQRVRICLEKNESYAAGPVNAPKGGFDNRVKPAPARGILKRKASLE